MAFFDLSLWEFTKALAGKQSVPGGGGAAALCGALGAALGAMVCEFTVGKPKYAEVEEDIKALLLKTKGLSERLLALIDEDAAGFEPLSKAYSIPKDEPGREETLEKATLMAIEAPLKMMRLISETIDALLEIEKKGSKMLVSDAGCGGALCAGALKASAMNVFINTKSLKDRDRAKEINEEANALLSKYVPLADGLSDRVTKGFLN